jgi:hypothetical protein
VGNEVIWSRIFFRLGAKIKKKLNPIATEETLVVITNKGLLL